MKFIFLITITLFFSQNLSAYEEISIQKTNNLKNYQELLKAINYSISDNDISDIVENHLYNINFSNSEVSFSIDLGKLSKNLYQKQYDFNLLMIDCSMRENFFKFNQNFNDCPNFKILTFNQEKFIYLNFGDNLYRLKKYNSSDRPNKIWLHFLNKSFNSYQTFIEPSHYNKLVKFTGIKPKIISYKNNLIEIETKSYFTRQQIQFLLNFF